MKNLKLMLKAIKQELSEWLLFIIFLALSIGAFALIDHFGLVEIVYMIILAAAVTGFVVFLLAALALKLSKVYTVYQDLKEKDADINKAIMDADEREMWG